VSILQTRVIELNNKIDIQNEKVKEITEDQRTYSSIYERKDVVLSLKEAFDKMSSIENIKTVTEVLLPRVKDFAAKVDDLLESNEEVRECIRRFDEDISIKANYS